MYFRNNPLQAGAAVLDFAPFSSWNSKNATISLLSLPVLEASRGRIQLEIEDRDKL